MEFMIKFWITCLIYLVFIFYPAKKRVLNGFIENKKGKLTVYANVEKL